MNINKNTGKTLVVVTLFVFAATVIVYFLSYRATIDYRAHPDDYTQVVGTYSEPYKVDVDRHYDNDVGYSTTEKYYYYVNYEYKNEQYKTSLYEYSDKMSGRTVELVIKKNAPDDAKKKSNLDNPGADFFPNRQM